MKSKILFLSVALICLLSSLSVASAGNEKPLTQNEDLRCSPSIYGNIVTWTDGRGEVAHVYDLTVGKEITLSYPHAAGMGKVPIYGNRIVFSDLSSGKVVVYDFRKGKISQITSGDTPEIYGDNIVYVKNNGGYIYDIYQYNLLTRTETKITNAVDVPGYDSPTIDGNKIVYLKEGSPGSDVYLYDISTHKESKISISGTAGNPDIYGNVVVWTDKGNIFIRDILKHKTKQITTNGAAGEPSIYGNRIVYTNSYSTGGSDIYMYEISSSKTTHITTSKCAYSPAIYNEKIVYVDTRNAVQGQDIDVRDIYMYDLAAKPDKRLLHSL
jgi:beta propeller repeat protein